MNELGLLIYENIKLLLELYNIGYFTRKYRHLSNVK